MGFDDIDLNDLNSASADACELRLEQIRALLDERGLDACYIRDLSTIKWVSAFIGVFDDEPAHALLVMRDKALLHTDSRYSHALGQAARSTSIDVSSTPVSHARFLADALLDSHPGNDTLLTVAIEDTLTLRERAQIDKVLSFALIEKESESCSEDHPLAIEIKVTEDLVVHLREVKDTFEVFLMRRAQRITDEAFVHICSFIKPQMSELEVQRELDACMFALGANGLAFPTIVATGEHAASPHAIPDGRLLEIGDAVVMDFGARFADYCSDMTRTVFIGEPSDELKRAWRAIRNANETCEAALRAGERGSKIHQLAEDILALHGFAGSMGHGLGHSLGIDIHEAPSLSLRNESPVPAGAVLTVEPGIYVPGSFGMRLEDFGLVTEEGFDVFTQSTHDMVIIDPQISS